MVCLWFLRHGQATHNVDAAARGPIAYRDPIHTDAPLTADGFAQACAALRDLPDEGGPPFTAIWCSPLRRCRQTLMASAPGHIPRAPVHLDDRLMEPQGSCTCNRRMEAADIVADVPASWDSTGVATANPFDADPVETQRTFDARVQDWTETVLGGYSDNDRVLIVAHYEWIRTWFRLFMARDVEPANAEVLRARWPPKKLKGGCAVPEITNINDDE